MSSPQDGETANEPTTQARSALGTFAGVLTQHNDLGRTGANLNETILTTANVKAGTFGFLKSLSVSGQVYAQPLYVPAAINNKNVLIVATEANKVYAYNADSPWDLLWSRTDFELPWSSTACSNTHPLLGISSTPVIDPVAKVIYVTSKTNQGGVFKYMLHTLDLTTGADKTGSPIDMAKDAHGAAVTVPGTGDGSTPGTGGAPSTLAFDPMRQLNRVALTLSQGVLSVGFASHCDLGNYHGWILRFDTRTTPPTPLAPFVTNPNTGHGGLWMGGAGFTVDANNDLYFVSGDGRDGLTNTNGMQLANAFVRLTTVGPTQTPSVGSWFMPSDVAALDTADKDLGSAGPLLIPGTSRIVGGGKNGIFYVLNTMTMGGFQSANPPDPQIVQRFAPTAAGNWIVGSPIFWDSPAGPRVYVWPGKTPLEAYAFDRTLGKFSSTSPVAQSVDNPQNDPQGGHLSLSANGATAGTGIVWANHGIGSPGGGDPVAGALYAFNAEDLSKKLWDSTQVPADALPSYAKYTPPTIANGKVYVGTFSDAVIVYGLRAVPVDAGAPHDARDAAPAPVVLSCGAVDGGAPQPTSWTYVYNTYFAPGTVGHCATCHGAAMPGGFLAGTTKDSLYDGLVHVGQITPAAGASSPIGRPDGSVLSWFGPGRPLPPLVNVFMPQNQQALNAAAVAAVCGWVGAGAVGDKVNGVACATGGECASRFCVDGFCCNSACNTACNACSNARTGAASGTCAVVSTGAVDPRCVTGPVCGNTGLCAAAGLCQLALATTSCRAASCTSGTATAAASCSGAGACPAVVTTPCAPFVCGATACKTTCAADTDCVAGDFCSGTACVIKKANGGTCTAINQCVSGSCVDGFCCNTACTGSCTACANAKTGAANGTCASTTVGVADARCTTGSVCGNTGLCAAGATCQQAPSTTSCRAASCASGVLTAAASCNGAGVCPAVVTTNCAPFICGSAVACGTTCTTAANCASGAQCTGGVCVGCASGVCKANGAVCAAGNECASNACVDGFCGNTACAGTCTACSNAKTGAANGTCAAMTVGATDARCTTGPVCGNTGKCAAGSTCQQAPSTTSCRTASCATGTATAAATCNGAGACPTAVTTACAPFVCGATACKATCAADTDCVAGDFCAATTCTPKKATGAACTAATQCTSGACVDGFCCNTACTGACTACAMVKTGAANGTCSTTVVGAADARCTITTVCGNTGLCAAGGVCQQAPSTTSCRTASCATGTATAAATCNGAGACPTAVTTACTPFVCGATACKTTCAADADCVAGDVCSGTTCVAKKATGSACTAATQCGSGACVDGFCCNSACTGACTACSAAKTGGANGTCAATTAGATDARCTITTTCGNTGLCAGAGVCQLAPTTTSCRSASCASGTAIAAATCNGVGACPTAVTAACTPYICGTTACKTSCTVAADCVTGLTCTGGVCGGAVCTAATAVVDDFEDANNQVRLLDGRNGPLYTYADTAGSTITPAAGSIFAPAAGGNGGTAFAAHFSGQLSGAATVWAGMGMDLLAPKSLYNGSKYTGVSFFAKKGTAAASGAVRFKVPDRNTDPTGGVCTACANDFGADIALTTTWTKFTVPFSSMTQQAGWGAPRPAHIDPTGLVAIQLQLTTPGAAYDIWIDDVTFTCN